MMASHIRVILFGDQTTDPCPLLKPLLRSSTSLPTLKAFFDKTADALRQELAHAEPSDRLAFPTFNTIPGLVEAYSQLDDPDVAVDSVLLCVYQLALVLTYVPWSPCVVPADFPWPCRQDRNDERIFEDHPSSTTNLVGLCTGMLPAAALAVTTSPSQLLRQAPDVVRVVLRLGLEARRRSAQIEPSRESWATIVPGIAPQEQQKALDLFHKEKVSDL